MRRWNSTAVKIVPVVASAGLVLAACGSGGGSANVAEQGGSAAAAPAGSTDASSPAGSTDAGGAAAAAAAPAAGASAAKAPAARAATAAKAPKASAKSAATAAVAAPAASKSSGGTTKVQSTESAGEKAANQKIYDRLYALYRQLHDSFGGVNKSPDLSQVMKDLLDIKAAQSA